jgi:hypothetical protein
MLRARLTSSAFQFSFWLYSLLALLLWRFKLLAPALWSHCFFGGLNCWIFFSCLACPACHISFWLVFHYSHCSSGGSSTSSFHHGHLSTPLRPSSISCFPSRFSSIQTLLSVRDAAKVRPRPVSVFLPLWAPSLSGSLLY